VGITFAVAAASLAVTAAPAQAVANPYRVESASANNATSPKSTTVSCPGGDRLVGTGARLEGGGNEVLLTRIIPDLATDSVTAWGIENVAVATNWQVVAWAVCAPAGTEPANLQQVSSTSALNASSPKTVSPACPVNTSVYSIGYELAAANGQVAIDEAEFDASLLSGSATAYAYNGFAGNWSLTTYLICGAASPNMSLVEWTSARNSLPAKTESTPTCSGTTQVHGVGAAIDGARGDAFRFARPSRRRVRAQRAPGPETPRECATEPERDERSCFSLTTVRLRCPSGSPLLRVLFPRVVQQHLEGASRACPRLPVCEQPGGVMARQEHAVEVLRELVRIGVGAEVPLGDPGAEDGRDHVEQVALVGHEPVAHWAGLVVVLRGRGHERAATGLRVPAQPAVEEFAHPRLALRGV
jgi:hypothetical protein